MPGSDATRYVKPGHWSMATHEVTANNFDAVCDFHAEVRSGGQPTDWPGTPFRLHTSQPAQLPKGKTRYLQTAFYVPGPPLDDLSLPEDGYLDPYYEEDFEIVVDPRQFQLSSSLHQRGGGLIQQQQPPLTVMKPHEYHFVVLSPWAGKYGVWRELEAFRPPDDSRQIPAIIDTRYHLVTPPVKTDRPPPLSSHPLTWTSMAYVLWDEFDPLALSAQQQQAMLDWLHWGGRLIISGPKSLDLLRGSFLSPYLPAVAEKAVELRASDLQALRDLFPGPRGGRELQMVKPWAGVKLALKERARMIPNTGDLLAERGVGRGRIVVTAFRLRERELNLWGRFDALVNTLLLRRQPQANSRLDPRETSDVRYFSRDFSAEEKFVHDGQPTQLSVAGWNDQSPVSDAARSSLREAAGIKIPEASFIVWVMAIYLIVLVPLNWGVFRLLGRVEWAWFAAPLITIVFTVAVVKLAQLDIGFARSQTEYCIVEVQGGYSRAHVTRYTALYASLSTSYEFEFDDDSALIGPFPNGEEVKDFQRRRTMTLRWAGNVTAKGFDVSSNSTGFVHSEQMFDLGGAIRLAGAAGVERIVNGSTLSLEGAVVIRQGVLEKSPLMAAWIGDLAPGDDALLEFSQRTPSARDRQEAAASSGESPDLKLKALLKLAYNHRPLKPGESRLIAWSSAEVPGMTVTPIASQVRRATLVVVHLAYALD